MTASEEVEMSVSNTLFQDYTMVDLPSPTGTDAPRFKFKSV